jgi:PTS system galactitol-specific IIA component
MVLDERLVLLGLEAKDSEEALRALAGKLVKLGKVKSSYPDAVVEREKIYPTGLEAKPVNAAVPHCSNDYTISDALAVAVLAHPVDFALMGSPEKPLPVQVLVMLAVVDPAKQVPTLVDVMELLDDEERMGAIVSAKTPADVIAAITPALGE